MCSQVARLQETKQSKNFIVYNHIFVLSSHKEIGSMVRQVISKLTEGHNYGVPEIHLSFLKKQKLLK